MAANAVLGVNDKAFVAAIRKLATETWGLTLHSQMTRAGPGMKQVMHPQQELQSPNAANTASVTRAMKGATVPQMRLPRSEKRSPAP